MPKSKLISQINNELCVCDAEIRKADDTINRMQERRLCYDMRKTMLQMLLDTAKAELTKQD